MRVALLHIGTLALLQPPCWSASPLPVPATWVAVRFNQGLHFFGKLAANYDLERGAAVCAALDKSRRLWAR